MKYYLKDFLGGILVVILTILTMNFITLDLRIVTFLIAILLMGYAYFFIKKRNLKWLSIILLVLPIATAFYFGILPELPGMWMAIVFFLFAAVIGYSASIKKVVFLGMALFAVFSFYIVPGIVEDNLSEHGNEAAPEVQFISIENGKMTSLKDFEAHVLVLDFFGTWCAPCIKEMDELKRVQEHFRDNSKVEIILVCTEQGGDTPDKVHPFMMKHNLDFKAYFDTGNVSHRNLKFTGVPALVILDQRGNVRFRHEGYNPSENLAKNLIDFINTLLP
ncbi:MAG: redoxin domain-containing protein [Croceivirga sp.]